MTDFHSYRPADGHGLPHDPLNAIVAPRPIGWVSTLSTEGKRNLAPYSFFNLFNYRPPIIGFCSVGWKDSVANAKATGEFVWNLATRDLAEVMNTTSAMTDADEFDLAGLETHPSETVTPPRVAASPVHFECKVTQIVQLTAADGSDIDSWMVLGQAMAIHIDKALLENGIYQTTRARPILRGGGPADYFEVGEKFLMRRPG
ncbi:flavin reductase family protein [Sphingosinithalassobacter portus]|uniref:flavin reductase family protein n=1 Tax=Stakelama portus TaxID=2676234 RepID=UPI000D6E623F|nr:flavin reductase family protein [Sphingosinithalassobacter portus]